MEDRIIKPADLRASDLTALLTSHLDKMLSLSPEESVHALDISKFDKPNVSLFCLYIDDVLAGCGALSQIDDRHVEIKSMKTSDNFLRKGVAREILAFLIAEAKERGYTKISLETGTVEAFIPAHRLYENAGFVPCSAFADYQEDPNSRFYSMALI